MDGVLAITVRRERAVEIAAVTGDIDVSTVTRLRERLFELADARGTLIVDLNRVTFIDSAGLGALVGAARRTRRQPACGLRPAADPQAVVADRGWTAGIRWRPRWTGR